MDKKIKYYSLGILLIIAFIIFGNSLASDFVFDDKAVVKDRPELNNIEHLPYLLFEPYHQLGFDGDAYRPITMISFSLNYYFFSAKPWNFHFINIILHSLASWLVFLLILKLTKKLHFSFLVSLIFLVLPIHTESINAIVGRAEILSLLFGLWSILILLKNKKIKRKISAQFWASLLFLFALLSKESAIGFLPLYFIILWINSNGKTFISSLKIIIKKYWKNFIYLIGATLLYFLMRSIVLDKIINTNPTIVENPLKFISWPERLLTAFKILGMYLIKIIWPLNNLSSDYSYNQIPTKINWLNLQMWLGIFTFAAIASLIIAILLKPKNKSNNKKMLILSCSFFLFFYISTSNIVFPIGTIMAERLMYIPSIAICILFGLLLTMLRSMLRNKIRNKNYSQYIYLLIVMILIIFYSSISFNRNFDWRNESNLFASAAARSPNSVLSRSNLGAIYLLENKLDLAEKEIMAAQNIYDNYNHNLNNLGLLYLKQGKLKEARDQFIFTLKNHPAYGPAIDNLALTYFQLGEYEKAKKFWGIIHNNKIAELYLIRYFNNEFSHLLKEKQKTQAKNLLEQAMEVVDDKKWLKNIEKAIK